MPMQLPHSDAVDGRDPARQDRRFLLQGMGLLPLAALVSACGGGGDADSSASPSATSVDVAELADASTVEVEILASTTAAFVHPGLLHTEADFQRMRDKIAAGAQPWLAGRDALTASSRARLRDPQAVATIVRGGEGENFRIMVEDMLRAYQYALRWKISGDTAYADAAVRFLDAWSSTLTSVTGNSDRFLAAGIYGYQWANAAEIMRTYSGWSAEGIASFQRLLLREFYPLCKQFLETHNGSNITNYWANWDLCNINAMLAIGVFCDRRGIYNLAIQYYKTGRGNGAAAHNVYALHPGHLGQWQESGRDQGHATLGMALAGPLCEMAWNQGDDLYGYWNNRLLSGAEYVAGTNLVDASGNYPALPFSVYANRQGVFTGVSGAGRPAMRYCWELIYNHYVNRKGLSAPYVSAMAARLRPERDAWNGDQPSMGTLSFSRDPIALGAPPSGLTAHLNRGAVELSWWGTAYATGYEVQRKPSPGGRYVTLATVGETRTYLDSPDTGTWYYRIVALSGSKRQTGVNVIRVAVPGELRLHLPLNEGSGLVAVDQLTGQAKARLVGTAGWGVGRQNDSAVALNGINGHVVLPSGIMNDLHDFTIAVWVYWNAGSTNTRVFDFGSSDIAYLALLPRDGAGNMRCSITGTHYFGEQSLVASGALPTGRWVHLAVTLTGTIGKLYVDGVMVDRNPDMSFAPFQLGATTQNWLGRSQYGNDPYFNGKLQDFRLYAGAISAARVARLAGVA
ncbi:MAG: LamG-like jellyroll fold domain-containing protein [Pseudomonadota bacterium]